MQEYFYCNNISKNAKLFTFKLRTRMIKVGGNFGQKEVCPVCKSGSNDQQHLLECSTLKLNIPELIQVGSKYDDIYEEDPTQVTNISQEKRDYSRSKIERTILETNTDGTVILILFTILFYPIYRIEYHVH